MYERKVVWATDKNELETICSVGHAGYRLVAVVHWSQGQYMIVFESPLMISIPDTELKTS